MESRRVLLSSCALINCRAVSSPIVNYRIVSTQNDIKSVLSASAQVSPYKNPCTFGDGGYLSVASFASAKSSQSASTKSNKSGHTLLYQDLRGSLLTSLECALSWFPVMMLCLLPPPTTLAWTVFQGV